MIHIHFPVRYFNDSSYTFEHITEIKMVAF